MVGDDRRPEKPARHSPLSYGGSSSHHRRAGTQGEGKRSWDLLGEGGRASRWSAARRGQLSAVRGGLYVRLPAFLHEVLLASG